MLLAHGAYSGPLSIDVDERQQMIEIVHVYGARGGYRHIPYIRLLRIRGCKLAQLLSAVSERADILGRRQVSGGRNSAP